jgi:hypothetical protein
LRRKGRTSNWHVDKRKKYIFMLGNLEGRDNKGNGVLHKIMNHDGHEDDAGPKKKTNKNGQGHGEYEGGSTTYKGKPFTE